MNAVALQVPAEVETPGGLPRLRAFVRGLADLISSTDGEEEILNAGTALLEGLVGHDDWLPETFARPHPTRYQQYLLHCDSQERFSVVSFVWGPGQSTPVHDHRVWGLVGVLRGAERVESYRRDASGRIARTGVARTLRRGQVDPVSPRIGDIHRVENAFHDRVSVSIHVYGANIGAVERAIYDASGQSKSFVSGYANDSLPNLWGRAGGAA